MHLTENEEGTVPKQKLLILELRGEGHNISGSYGSNPRRRDPLSLGKLSLLRACNLKNLFSHQLRNSTPTIYKSFQMRDIPIFHLDSLMIYQMDLTLHYGRNIQCLSKNYLLFLHFNH